MTIREVNETLDRLLRQAGCQQYSGQEARSDMREVWRDVREDAVAQGEAAGGAFFTFVVVENVGVFTFFEEAVGIFVIPGQEADFRSRFDSLAMGDVHRAKRLLAQYFRKSAPDLVINAALRDAWLDSPEDHSGS
jgi:hypothetical protein